MENINSFKKSFALFVLILVFLCIPNFIVYKALLIAFNISGVSFLLIGILGVLMISFLISIFLGMNFYNFFTRIYYLISMLWLGFFGYLFFSSVLYILEFSILGDPSRLFAFFLFGFVFLISIYGAFHAKKLIIKNININISNIPNIWRNKKAVWISDLHIGQINGEKYIERIVDNLENISPEIIFIGGDLFDGSSVKGILDCILPFKKLSIPQGTYFITGNHENYGKNELFLQKIKEVGINILQDEKIVLNDLQIIGVDFKSTVKKDIFERVLNNLNIDKRIPSILLKHEPKHIEIAQQMGISFQISGHTHKAQQWPFEYFARIFYGVFTYGLSKSEEMQVYTSSGAGTWGPPIRVGTDSEIVVFTFI